MTAPAQTTHKASTYLILEAKRSNWYDLDEHGLRPVEAVRVIASRTNRPTKLARDQIAVRVSVEVEDSAFSPVTADLALSIDPANLIRPVLTDVAPEPAGDAE